MKGSGHEGVRRGSGFLTREGGLRPCSASAWTFGRVQLAAGFTPTVPYASLIPVMLAARLRKLFFWAATSIKTEQAVSRESRSETSWGWPHEGAPKSSVFIEIFCQRNT